MAFDPLQFGALITADTGARMLGMRMQGDENMRLARYQNEANRQYLREYLDYNTPKNQMARFQEAGLNPHLIYGQGNPGNQSAPLEHPAIQPRDFSQLMGISDMVNRTMLSQSQVQAQGANTMKALAQTELTKLQQSVVRANPLLNKDALSAVISSLQSSAQIKQSEADIIQQRANVMVHQKYSGDAFAMANTVGEQMIIKELDLLEQKFHLGQADAAIKAQVLESKEFQNAILEVQKRFMTNGDVTPQHILQFAQLVLLKLLTAK